MDGYENFYITEDGEVVHLEMGDWKISFALAFIGTFALTCLACVM